MKIILKKYICYILVILTIIFSILFTNLYKLNSKYKGNEKEIIGNINEINIDGNKVSILISSKEKIVCNYYIKNKNEKTYFQRTLKLGDKIKLVGDLSVPNNNTVPNMFNYKKYLYNKKIFWILNVDKLEKLEDNKNVFYNLKNKIIKRIDKYKYSKGYLYAFLLGNTDILDSNVIDSYRNNGISHLFAVSGMHVSLVTGIILFLLKKMKIKPIISYIICTLILLFYIFLTNFSPSIIRASLFFIGFSLKKILKLNIKNINLVLIILCLIIIFNPFIIYNIGFQYSYIISLGLIILSNFIKEVKHYLPKLFVISLIAFLLSFPITIYNFYQINLLSIIFNLIFVPLISFIIFPCVVISFFIYPLDLINKFFINILENLSLFISNIKIFNIILAKPSIIIIILYYVIILFVIYMFIRKKYYYLLIISMCILIHTNISYFNNKLYMIMIDQTTPNMIQGLKGIFAIKPLISRGI